MSSGEKAALRDAIEALARALGLASANALWEAARVNKNDWNDRLRPYVSKPIGRKQVDRLVDGLVANLGTSAERRRVLELHRSRLYEAIGIDLRLVSDDDDAVDWSPDPDPALAALRERVHEVWIHGVLDRSIAKCRVELDMVARPRAVERSWEVAAIGDEPDVTADGRIADIFERAQRQLLILGAPGSGKTTSLLELARQTLGAAASDRSRPVPAVLLLTAWSADHDRFEDWLLAELNLRYQVPGRHARRWLADGRLILLLDGLDELPAASRAECVRAINGFRQGGYGHVGIAVTCRTDAYEAMATRLRLEGAIVIEPLTDAQISRQLELDGHAGLAVRRIIERDKRLHELAHSPLMLAIAQRSLAEADADLEHASMPVARGRVFDRYLDHGYRRRGREYSWEQTLRCLSWLARNMSTRGRSIFSVADLQPSWLPWPWSTLCAGLVTIAIGLILTAPALLLSGLWTGGVVPAFAWAVVFWLAWTLRSARRWNPVALVAACLGGALALRTVQGWADPTATPAGIVTSSVLMGLTLALAWALTWLVRSRELLDLLHGDWWWRRRSGVALCLAGAVPFLWLLPADDAGGASQTAGSVGLGLLVGIGAGAACLPAWQPGRWDRLLRPSLSAVAACLAATLALFPIRDPASALQPHGITARAVFIGLLLGMMATFLVALRRLNPPRLPPESWSGDDIVVAGAIFTACLSFIPKAATLSTLLAVVLALALDPASIHRRRVRPDWRRVLAVLLLSPLLVFFLSAAGVLESPGASLTVAGVHVESSGPLSLGSMLVTSVVAGTAGALILLAAVGFRREDDEPRAIDHRRLALIVFPAVAGLAAVTWTAVIVGYGTLFGSSDPAWAVAATLMLVTVIPYGALIGGGAIRINHAVCQLALRRLGIAPADFDEFLLRGVDMMILRRVGDQFLFVHPLLQEHLATRDGTVS